MRSRSQHSISRAPVPYASWKDLRTLAKAIRPIYTVASAEAAEAKLDAFDDAPSMLIWLALRNITADWGCAAKWTEAMDQFAILYQDRFTRPAV